MEDSLKYKNRETNLTKFEIPVSPERSRYDPRAQAEMLTSPFDYEGYNQSLNAKVTSGIRMWSSVAMQERMVEQIETGNPILFKIFLNDWESLHSNEPSIFGKGYFYSEYQECFHPSNVNRELSQRQLDLHLRHLSGWVEHVIKPLSQRLLEAEKNCSIESNFLDRILHPSFAKVMHQCFSAKQNEIVTGLLKLQPTKKQLEGELTDSIQNPDASLSRPVVEKWLDYMTKTLEIYDTSLPTNTDKKIIIRYLGLEVPENLALIEDLLAQITANEELIDLISDLPGKMNFGAKDAFGAINYQESDGDKTLDAQELKLVENLLIDVSQLLHPDAPTIIKEFLTSQNNIDLKSNNNITADLICNSYYRNQLVFIEGYIPEKGLSLSGLAHELGHFIAQILNNRNFPYLHSLGFARTYVEVPSILFQLLFMEKLKKLTTKSQNLPTIDQLNRDICRSIIVRYIPKCLFEIDFLNKISILTPENIEHEIQKSYKAFFTDEHSDVENLLKQTLKRLLQPWNVYNYLTSLLIVIPLVKQIIDSDFNPDNKIIDLISELMGSAGIVSNSEILREIDISESLNNIHSYINEL